VSELEKEDMEYPLSETTDIEVEETEDNQSIKESSVPSITVPMEIYTEDKLNIFKDADLIKTEDIQYLQEHRKKYQDRFYKRSFFRSDFEMKYSVLSDSVHPTIDSKYWQAIGEQAVHVQETILLGFEYQKSSADIEYTKAQIEDFEYQLSQDFEHEFNRKKIEAKLKKKQVQLREKEFGLVLQKKTAKERMKEIRNWDKIIEELEPQVKNGLDDFEKHHAERYIKRYGQKLQNLNLLEADEKDHVVKHFISFAQAPENKELAEKYIAEYQQNSNKSLAIEQVPNQKQLTNPLAPEIEKSQINYSSKKEMMEKDPITQKFFNRKVRKILIGTPHRTNPKENPFDRNVTDFSKVQMPAAMDVIIDQPYGLSVSDARNYIVNKAIKEEYDYIFFVDDDVLIPRNALVQLIHHKTDIVGGFYYRKYFPLESVGMIEDEENCPIPIEDFKIGDVIHNTLVLPSGITLFKTDVFKKMEPIWYRTCTVNDKPTITEDTFICQRIRDLGFDIITDTGIQGIHINKETGLLYGHKSIVNQEKNQVYENYREYFAI